MSEILVLAEKPSVARDIARVLGANTRGENCLFGNGYRVTWALGHLVGLADPEEVDEKYKKWRRETLPILPDTIPLKVLTKTRSQFSAVKKMMNSPDTASIICATDSGREGELIFRYIYQLAGCKKDVQRLWISSLTEEAIREGFRKLKPGSEYDPVYRSARCRSEADWLVGMNASRAFTLRYDVLLSVGRVQTPTLALLVRRRKEIDSFVPEAYWQVKANFGTHTGLWFDREKEGHEHRISSQEKAQALADKVKGQPARVVKAEEKEKSEPAPQLYDLTSLQRDANRYFGFSAAKTLNLAQSLYETHKLLTYPRTDSRYLSHDMVPVVGKTLKALPEKFREFTAPLLEKGISVTKRVFDDEKLTDHHAIIPTGRTVAPEKLSQDEGKLFDLVCRRFVAAFLPPFRYMSSQIVTEAREEWFLTEGTRTLEEGFKAVYRDLSKEKKASGEELDGISQGDECKVKSATVLEDKTKPPKEHTDASLLYEMEHAGRNLEDEALREEMKQCGLGTPATRAATIERLLQVGYAQRKGKTILATPKGVRLIEAVPEAIASPEITGRWERHLEQIAAGGGDEERFMGGIRKYAAYLVSYAAEKAPSIAFDPEEKRGKGRGKGLPVVEGLVCPLCGQGKVTETEKAFGCSRWQSGCRFTLWKNALERSGGPTLNQKLVKLLLENPEHRLRGSTGTIVYENGRLQFIPLQK